MSKLIDNHFNPRDVESMREISNCQKFKIFRFYFTCVHVYMIVGACGGQIESLP